MNKFLILLIVAVLVGSIWYAVDNYKQKQPDTAIDYRNAEYIIEGEKVKLADGSSSKVTHYFGNELKTDLDGDGREDAAFIITRQGGSGTFFYAVAAINTGSGYVGSDGYFLGDRIAPQPTTLSPNPRHKYVVVFNYADRSPTDPMTAPPTVGKSVYLKLDPTTMRWAIVEPDFEGESR